MITKKELLKNIRSYSPEEIADAIKNGVVSMYELSKETEGAFTPLLKRQVEALLNATESTYQEDRSHDTALEQATDIADEIESEEDNVNISSDEQTVLESSDKPQENTKMFSKIFSFKGRIRRTEYGLTYLANIFLNILLNIIAEFGFLEAFAVIYLLLIGPTIWILLAQGAKRCHDRGNSGWFQIIPFYFFWMVFAEGDSGANKYGESPK